MYILCIVNLMYCNAMYCNDTQNKKIIITKKLNEQIKIKPGT